MSTIKFPLIAGSISVYWKISILDCCCSTYEEYEVEIQTSMDTFQVYCISYSSTDELMLQQQSKSLSLDQKYNMILLPAYELSMGSLLIR